MEEQNKEQREKNNTNQNPPALNEGHKNTMMAVLSYIGPLVIIPYLTAKEDSFVKFHIKQGLALLILWIIVWLLGMILWRFWILIQALNLLIIILAVIGIINVLQGHEKELPAVGQFAKYFTF